MADSVTVTITVVNPTYQTYFPYFDVTPTSGAAPLAVNVSGYLSRYAGSRETSAFLLNGEPIKIQSQNASGAWIDIGTATTHNDENPPIAYDGAFEATITLNTEGTYAIRAHYDGNTSKGLLGCE